MFIGPLRNHPTRSPTATGHVTGSPAVKKEDSYIGNQVDWELELKRAKYLDPQPEPLAWRNDLRRRQRETLRGSVREARLTAGRR